jgi:hypothetical protein
LATLTVPGRSLNKPGLPRSLLGSATTILSNTETKGADFLCQLLKDFRAYTARGLVLLPSNRSFTCPLHTWGLLSCPLQTLQAPEFPLLEPSLEPLIDHPKKRTLLIFYFFFCSINCDPTSIGGNIRSTNHSPHTWQG